jgi:DNA-directed RNA polymerase specialized sigma24 family protein
MVCRNDEFHVAVQWDDKTVYGFVIEPSENQKKLISAVNKLPIICRKVMILYALGGVQRQEIAAILKISLAATRFLIHRSGLLLQEYLVNQEKQDSFIRNNSLKEKFSDWPYTEYSKLVELRKNIVFLE